jgi:hypothetical protein
MLIMKKMIFKKITVIMFAIALFAASSTNVVFAKDISSDLQNGNSSNSVCFNGNEFDKSSLSSKTTDWLDWFNNLSPESQAMVSYTPNDLQKNTMQIDSKESVLADLDAELDGISAKIARLSLMPIGGGEPVYNPNYWNESSRIKKANCYAYALQVLCSTDMKLQPGQIAGKQFQSLTTSSIITAAQADAPYIKSSISATTYSAKPTSKQYKIALVIAPNTDYHWYIQNSNGYWSHKPGWTKVTNVDASGNSITDPMTCNRNYGSLNYSSWCGYYMVTKN